MDEIVLEIDDPKTGVGPAEAALVETKSKPGVQEAVGELIKVSDPGLFSLTLRRHDFGSASIEERELTAYQPFAPGIWIGFQPGGQAWIRNGRGASGEEGVILTLEPGPSSWMSLEMELDISALAETGSALVTVEAAANPPSGLSMFLRIPCESAETGFWDTRAQSVALLPDLSARSLAFFPQMDRLQPHDGLPRAVLIAFMPLRRTELFLSALAFGPALRN